MVYWIHILHVLTVGYGHIHHNPRALYAYYIHHHALAFLRSGITSGSGGKSYLWWLVRNNIAPVDW